MGAVVSSLGFNQPFLIALIGIMCMLGITIAVAGGDYSDPQRDLIPQIRVRPCAPVPRKDA